MLDLLAKNLGFYIQAMLRIAFLPILRCLLFLYWSGFVGDWRVCLWAKLLGGRRREHRFSCDERFSAFGEPVLCPVFAKQSCPDEFARDLGDTPFGESELSGQIGRDN